jgi:hypothetical protein
MTSRSRGITAAPLLSSGALRCCAPQWRRELGYGRKCRHIVDRGCARGARGQETGAVKCFGANHGVSDLEPVASNGGQMGDARFRSRAAIVP